MSGYKAVATRDSAGIPVNNYGATEEIDASTRGRLHDMGPPHPRTFVKNLMIMSLCTMTGDSSRGIGFPTLWLFVESLHGDHEDLGFAVALFSAGRIVSSPLLGHLSDVWGYRLVLTVAMCVMAAGCLFYMAAGSLSALYVAQFSIGMGAGVLGVTRAYVFCSCSSFLVLHIYYCLPAFSDTT